MNTFQSDRQPSVKASTPSIPTSCESLYEQVCQVHGPSCDAARAHTVGNVLLFVDVVGNFSLHHCRVQAFEGRGPQGEA